MFIGVIIVKKFGGTSLGSLERIEHVANRIINDIKEKGEKPIVVASAMSGETNRLIGLAHKVSPQDRSSAYDMLLASGEQVSISLLSMALSKRGFKAKPMLAFQLGIRTNSMASKASIESINTELVNKMIEENIVPVVAGFQGLDSEGNITTLGRGGSDTTAVALSAALSHPVCEIYTDVPAVYTADPRLVPKAKPIDFVFFPEMMEMAALGSKVLHTRCVEMAAKFNVKIHLRSTFETQEGTWIVPQGDTMEKPVVTAVTHDPNTTVFKLFPIPETPSFLSDIFTKLAAQGIIVDIITQSQSEDGQRLAFSVHNEDVSNTHETLKTMLDNKTKVDTMEGMAKVSVVGVGMQNQFGVASRFFKAMAAVQSSIHLVTTSDIKISAVIDKTDLEKSALALHKEFQLEE